MEGAVTSNPLGRLLVVLIPGLALAILLGMIIGEGNTTIGVLILALAIGLIVVMLLGRRGQLEAAVVGFLIFGYFVGNRGFAQLAPIQPIFVGELGMVIVVALLGMQALLRRDFPPLKNPLVLLVSLFFALGAARFVFDFRTYRVDAVRDFATVYYAAFFYAAYQLGKREATRRALHKWIIAAVVAHCVIAVLFVLRPDILSSYFVIRGAPLFIQKGDLTATFSAVGVFFLALHRRVLGLKWLRVALLLLLIVALGIGIARAATLGLIVATGLVWLAGERRFFAYPVIGAVVAAILALLVFASGSSINKVAAVASFQEKMVSMVDFSGTYKYQTDLGAMKADNNEFRRAFWKIMVDETTTKNPLLGMGFGYNFLPRFEAYYNRGGWEGLRSPHNIFITMYGRLGAVGVLLFGLLAGLIFRDAIRAAIQVRQGRLARLDLAYWCGTVVFLVSGTFGVVLEGPMGGIPFWTFLGLAASSAALPPTAKTPVSAPRPAYAERRVRVRRENVPVLAARPGRA